MCRSCLPSMPAPCCWHRSRTPVWMVGEYECTAQGQLPIRSFTPAVQVGLGRRSIPELFPNNSHSLLGAPHPTAHRGGCVPRTSCAHPRQQKSPDSRNPGHAFRSRAPQIHPVRPRTLAFVCLPLWSPGNQYPEHSPGIQGHDWPDFLPQCSRETFDVEQLQLWLLEECSPLEGSCTSTTQPRPQQCQILGDRQMRPRHRTNGIVCSTEQQMGQAEGKGPFSGVDQPVQRHQGVCVCVCVSEEQRWGKSARGGVEGRSEGPGRQPVMRVTRRLLGGGVHGSSETDKPTSEDEGGSDLPPWELSLPQEHRNAGIILLLS